MLNSIGSINRSRILINKVRNSKDNNSRKLFSKSKLRCFDECVRPKNAKKTEKKLCHNLKRCDSDKIRIGKVHASLQKSIIESVLERCTNIESNFQTNVEVIRNKINRRLDKTSTLSSENYEFAEIQEQKAGKQRYFGREDPKPDHRIVESIIDKLCENSVRKDRWELKTSIEDYVLKLKSHMPLEKTIEECNLDNTTLLSTSTRVISALTQQHRSSSSISGKLSKMDCNNYFRTNRKIIGSLKRVSSKPFDVFVIKENSGDEAQYGIKKNKSQKNCIYNSIVNKMNDVEISTNKIAVSSEGSRFLDSPRLSEDSKNRLINQQQESLNDEVSEKDDEKHNVSSLECAEGTLTAKEASHSNFLGDSVIDEKTKNIKHAEVVKTIKKSSNMLEKIHSQEITPSVNISPQPKFVLIDTELNQTQENTDIDNNKKERTDEFGSEPDTQYTDKKDNNCGINENPIFDSVVEEPPKLCNNSRCQHQNHTKSGKIGSSINKQHPDSLTVPPLLLRNQAVYASIQKQYEDFGLHEESKFIGMCLEQLLKPSQEIVLDGTSSYLLGLQQNHPIYCSKRSLDTNVSEISKITSSNVVSFLDNYLEANFSELNQNKQIGTNGNLKNFQNNPYEENTDSFNKEKSEKYPSSEKLIGELSNCNWKDLDDNKNLERFSKKAEHFVDECSKGIDEKDGSKGLTNEINLKDNFFEKNEEITNSEKEELFGVENADCHLQKELKSKCTNETESKEYLQKDEIRAVIKKTFIENNTAKHGAKNVLKNKNRLRDNGLSDHNEASPIERNFEDSCFDETKRYSLKDKRNLSEKYSSDSTKINLCSKPGRTSIKCDKKDLKAKTPQHAIFLKTHINSYHTNRAVPWVIGKKCEKESNASTEVAWELKHADCSETNPCELSDRSTTDGAPWRQIETTESEARNSSCEGENSDEMSKKTINSASHAILKMHKKNNRRFSTWHGTQNRDYKTNKSTFMRGPMNFGRGFLHQSAELKNDEIDRGIGIKHSQILEKVKSKREKKNISVKEIFSSKKNLQNAHQVVGDKEDKDKIIDMMDVRNQILPQDIKVDNLKDKGPKNIHLNSEFHDLLLKTEVENKDYSPSIPEGNAAILNSKDANEMLEKKRPSSELGEVGNQEASPSINYQSVGSLIETPISKSLNDIGELEVIQSIALDSDTSLLNSDESVTVKKSNEYDEACSNFIHSSKTQEQSSEQFLGPNNNRGKPHKL